MSMMRKGLRACKQKANKDFQKEVRAQYESMELLTALSYELADKYMIHTKEDLLKALSIDGYPKMEDMLVNILFKQIKRIYEGNDQ